MKAFLFAVLLASAAALTLQVDAKRRECFFEPLIGGQSVKLFWEVLKGGKLDLDIEVTSRPPYLQHIPSLASARAVAHYSAQGKKR
jgi:hypothetical protein